MQKNISVVISANDTAVFLEKVLLGYNTQTYRNFELFIVCNKVTAVVEELAERLKKEVFYKIEVVEGDIVQAVRTAATDYVLFSNENCIPRADFVEQHIKYREEGFYLTGNSIPVKNSSSVNFTIQNLYTGSAFKAYTNISNSGLGGSILNGIISSGTKWNMQNASAWRKDIKTVMNGAAMPASFGNALRDSGLKSKQVGFSAVCLCLNN